MSRGFGHIETWVFDLDNTLYPPSCRLFDQVDVRMGEFISRLLKVDRVEAKRVQKKFFHEYGTTLRGLMTEHDVNPDVFLDFVHDIDHSPHLTKNSSPPWALIPCVRRCLKTLRAIWKCRTNWA